MIYKVRDVLRKDISRYELVWKESMFKVLFSNFNEILTNTSATKAISNFLEG